MFRIKIRGSYIKFVSIFIFISIIFPFVTLAQVDQVVTSTSSTSAPLELPENFSQSKNFIVPLLKKLPSISIGIFKQRVEPVWRKMAYRAKNSWSRFWYSYLKPKIQVLIDKIVQDLNLKFKEKEPQIKENFQKQKKIIGQDIQKQIPGIKKTIWQRIKELLK